MTIPKPSRPSRRRVSHAAQGGSMPKDWSLEELKLYGAIEANNTRQLDLSGEIHPVFANWSVEIEPRLRRELEQPLLLASKLLDGTGLHWISNFIIEDIFSEKYPGRYAKVTTTGLTLDTSTARLSQGKATPNTTPPLSPSLYTADSSMSSSSYTSPRSSSSSPSLVYSALTSPSPSPFQLKDFPFPYPSSFLQTNPATSEKPSPLSHSKSASTSVLFGRNSVYINTTAPETIFRHRRAPWWTRGLETKWLHRADRWLRRELGPALIWRLGSNTAASSYDGQCSGSCGMGIGGDLTNSNQTGRSKSQHGDFEVIVPTDLAERLATLRLAGETESEEYLFTTFMTAMAVLHELGHAVFWRGCHPYPYLKNSELSREPFYGADLEMELGDSFVASIFGGWVPVPVVIPDADATAVVRYTRGLAWRQSLSWDKHRIRPKYRAHYSIPIDHIALLFSQASWDCCDVHPEALIYPLALVQDKTASLTNTVGLITNAAVLKREHATAALPDFVTHPSSDGLVWNQTRKGTSFRIMQFGGRLCLDLDLPVAMEGVIQEALPEEPASSASMRVTAARERFAGAIKGAGNGIGLDSPTLPQRMPSMSKKPKKPNTSRRLSRTSSPTKLRPLSIKDKNATMKKTTPTATKMPVPELKPDITTADPAQLQKSSSANKLRDDTDQRISAITRKLKSLHANRDKQLPPLPADAIAAATKSSKRISLRLPPPQPQSAFSSSSSSSSSAITTTQSTAQSNQSLVSGSTKLSSHVPQRSMTTADGGNNNNSTSGNGSRRQFRHAKSFSTSITGIGKPFPHSLTSSSSSSSATVSAMISAATSLTAPSSTTTKKLLPSITAVSSTAPQGPDFSNQSSRSGRTKSMTAAAAAYQSAHSGGLATRTAQNSSQKDSPRHNSFTAFSTFHRGSNGGSGGGLDKELTYEELDSRLQNMIDTSITELEWLYF